MRRFTVFVCVVLPAVSNTKAVERPQINRSSSALTATDWPWWRGPNRDGVASADQELPLEWSESKNVLWKCRIPGRGHGSPTVVGNQIFLATADEANGVQSLLCIDRRTGQRVWKTDVHRGGLEQKGNKKASQASATVACDGQRVFINFLNAGALYTTCLNRTGKRLWQKKITDYVTHQGYGSSPAVYGSLVIVSADNKGGGAIAAMDRITGTLVWRKDRPKTPNYASPAILRVDGRDQLLFTGCDLVSSFEPLTGKKLWEIEGSTTECVTTTVTDGRFIFTSGGYPRNHMSAVRADGSGRVEWENNTRVYVPSMLVHEGYLYTVSDPGIASCWKCKNGEQVWKGRLGGTFSASPVLVGAHILATNEEGKTFIYKANPQAFELVRENKLGDEVFSTPTICGSRIFMRVAAYDDQLRQETLYCIGTDAASR